MELKHKKEKELGNEKEVEKKARWHSKFMDSVTEIAVSIGKNLRKMACTVAVPAIVAVGATGCYSSYQRYDEEMPVDSSTDTAVDTGYDSSTDTIEEDTIEDTVEEDVPDVEIPSPCGYLTESVTAENLIGDYLNRRLGDRGENVSGDTDAEYSLGASETSENANPFTDGMGGNIGPSETFMHRITGADFVPIADSSVYDDNADVTYEESENIWMNGSSYYADALYDVTGDVRFAAYTVKFSGESDDFGIPVCTTGTDGDYTYCKSDAEYADYAYATEAHRVHVKFLGEDWVITGMSAPVVDVSNEIEVAAGGHVKLAKEAVAGIVNQFESLSVAGLRFQLDDLETHAGRTAAVISVLNSDDEVLKMDTVYPGQTIEFNIDGAVYKLHVYMVAPGYSFDAKWADMAILSDEIKIEDGQEFDEDSGRFPDWQSFVGWKNKEVSSGQPDHLRTFGIYADDIATISSSGSNRLLPGDGFSFPYEFGVCYGGLDTTDENLQRVTFYLAKDEDIRLDPSLGPLDPVTGENVLCTIFAPYVTITVFDDSEIYGEMFSYVALSGAHCEGSIGELSEGSEFHYDQILGYHEFIDYADHTMIGFAFGFGDLEEEPLLQTTINWYKWDNVYVTGIANHERPINLDRESTFVFQLYEDALAGPGSAYDDMFFATDGNALNQDVYYTDTGEDVFKSGYIKYRYAGPVNYSGSLTYAEEGYITERGSVFSSISDTQVQYYISDQVAYSVFYIGEKD